jgi:hypothetical membrane protein
MNIKEFVHKFHGRLPWVGPLLWIATVQNFAVIVYAARDFKSGYNWKMNHISDLGNTACGWFHSRYVCSPHHGVVNLSYIAMGLAMIFGALLIYQEFRSGRWALTGFTGVAIAGVGAILVGIFPENTIHWLHLFGAGLVLLIGNLALIIIGLSVQVPVWFKYYSIASGVIALTALGLFTTDHYLGLGYGSLERTTTDLEIIWQIVFGIYALLSAEHF